MCVNDWDTSSAQSKLRLYHMYIHILNSNISICHSINRAGGKEGSVIWIEPYDIWTAWSSIISKWKWRIFNSAEHSFYCYPFSHYLVFIILCNLVPTHFSLSLPKYVFRINWLFCSVSPFTKLKSTLFSANWIDKHVHTFSAYVLTIPSFKRKRCLASEIGYE